METFYGFNGCLRF